MRVIRAFVRESVETERFEVANTEVIDVGPSAPGRLFCAACSPS